MWRKQPNRLIAEERNLLNEEKLLVKMLKEIRSQRNSLQIERLQLESMKNAARKAAASDQTKKIVEKTEPDTPKSPEARDKYLEQLDAPKQCNTKTLDLSIVNALDLILEGEYVGSEQDSEEESE